MRVQRVYSVACPRCGGTHTMRWNSKEDYESGYLSINTEEWHCTDCGKSFMIECKRRLTQFIYTGKFDNDVEFELEYDDLYDGEPYDEARGY